MENNFKRRDYDQNENSKRKKKNYNIKEEIPVSFKHNSNSVTYFKIINNEAEFNTFNQDLNLDATFSPKFTNQVFNQTEEIIGYKNLKILISLTPKLLFPYIKINFDESLNLKDDLNYLLEKHYEISYNTSQQAFLDQLKDENQSINKGLKIFNSKQKDTEKELEIYFVDILKDEFVKESMNLQTIITFFIDGASSIPLENNYWHYFLLYEKEGVYLYLKKSQQKLIGFCSTYHFHMSLDKYRSMISQFLILPQYQKKGYGQMLLDKIYDYYIEDKMCIEVTVEDPAVEFILLRDITIFSKIVNNGLFEKFISLSPVDNIQKFKQIKLTKEQVLNITKSLKIPKNLVYRCLEIFKYLIVLENPSIPTFYNTFKNEIKMRLFHNNKADMDPSYLLNNQIRKGPYISFYDDENFQIDVKELLSLIGNEISRNEKLELYYIDLEGDYKQISSKCQKILKEYNISI